MRAPASRSACATQFRIAYTGTMRRALFLALASLAACGLDVTGQLAGGTGPGGDAGPGASLPGTAAPADGAPPPDLDAGADATPRDAGGDGGAGASAALEFKGSDHVSAGALLAIPIDFTLEAWVRPASHGGERYVVAKDRRNQGQGQLRLGFDATGHLFFIMSDSAGSDHGLFAGGYVLQSPAIVPTKTWSHVAVTKSGAAFALYVDGAQVKTATANASFSHGGPAVDFRVAARVDTNGTSANGGFDGAIDEVRVWKVARSPAQIAAARAAVVDPTSASFADLAAYWRFDEGAGTSAGDTLGAFPGTLAGTPKWTSTTPF